MFTNVKLLMKLLSTVVLIHGSFLGTQLRHQNQQEMQNRLVHLHRNTESCRLERIFMVFKYVHLSELESCHQMGLDCPLM